MQADSGTHLTFSTVQTLARVNLDNLKFGCVIVDECHHAVQSYKSTSMFAKVMNQISCRYKFGLTATPYRGDGLEKGQVKLHGTAREFFSDPKKCRELNILPPYIVRMKEMLNEKGFDIPESVVNMKELADYIAKEVK